MNDVQETLRKLKPIIGQRADQFWIAYLSEDHDGKAELETVLNLWALKLLGNSISTETTNLSAPTQEVANGEYPIGHVTYAGKTLFPFGIREDEWLQHTAIFGRSGAGKTNAVFVILRELFNKNKKFLIFDWKRNYRDLLGMASKELAVYTVGRNVAPFQFNPLIPPDGTDSSTWLKKLIEIVAHSYYVGEGVMFLLQEAISAVYTKFKVQDGKPTAYPTFEDVHQWLEEHPAKGRKAQWMDSAMRAIKSICFGFMGQVVNTNHQPNIAALLEKNVILELDALTDADKSLIIESLLLWIHHYRLAQPQRETFKHAIIIEEAHHILLKRAGGADETITDKTLREIRELGEAILLIDQHPSLISIPALGNTYTTITLNLKHRSDVTAIAAAMLLDEDERELIGRLPIGSAIVKLQGRWVEPFEITIPHVKVTKGSINDATLRLTMEQRGLLLTATSTQENTKEDAVPELSEREVSFLRDITEHPFSGVIERYRRLSISRRKGNKTKERLLELEMIKTIPIPTRSGLIVLLELTKHGVQALRKTGIELNTRGRWGSTEHEYFKHKAAEYFERNGYTVAIEEPVNGFTDLVIQRDGKRTAVEVETGKSDWQKNLDKNLKKGFEHIIIITTNTETHQEITQAIQDRFPDQRITLLPSQNIL